MTSLGGGEQITSIEDDQFTGMGEGQKNTTKQEMKLDITGTNQEKHQNLTVCPMCKGKGYYEEIANTEQLYFINQSKSEKKKVELPEVLTKPGKLERSTKTNSIPRSKMNSAQAESTAPKRTSRPRTRFPSVHIPHVTAKVAEPNRSLSQASSATAKVSRFPDIINILPQPKKLERQPEDLARLAAIKLNRNDWEAKRSGLEDCLQLCNFHPDVLEPQMSLVYRALSWLLTNYRPQMTLFACQAARDFFVKMRSVCRPHFDELVWSLLQRTADNNRYVRLDSNNALDKMVTYVPTVHAVRALVDKGPRHKNPLVRTATARLITCIVALRTANTILTLPNLRDTCKKILETATLLMDDGSLDVRETAKKLMQRFVNEEDFEGIYLAEVDENLRKRIDRSFVQLKYKKHLNQDEDL